MNGFAEVINHLCHLEKKHMPIAIYPKKNPVIKMVVIVHFGL